VRLDRHGIGVHEGLKHVFAGELMHAIQIVRIALVQGIADLGVVLAGDLQAQPVVLHTLAPDVVDLGFAVGPRRLLALVAIGFVLAEIETLLEQLACIGGALANTLLIQVEDGVRHRQILVVDRVAELVALRGKAVDVDLGEEQAVDIQRIEITIKNLRRHLRIERLGLVMKAREETCRQQGGLGLLSRRLEQHIAGFRRGLGPGGAGEHQRDQGHISEHRISPLVHFAAF